MVKTGCRDAPCHSPEELKRRLKEPGVDIEAIKRELLRELRELEARAGKK